MKITSNKNLKKALLFLIEGVIAVGVIVFISKYIKPTQLAEVWNTGSSPLLLSTIPFAIVYLTTLGVRFFYLLAKREKPDLFDAAIAYIAAQPATLVPGGFASRIAFLSTIGIDTKEGSVAVILNSAFTQYFTFFLACVAGLFFGELFLYAAVGFVLSCVLAFLLIYKPSRDKIEHSTKKLNGNLPQKISNFFEDLADAAPEPPLAKVISLTFIAIFCKVAIMWLIIESFGISIGVPLVVLAATAPGFIGKISGLPAGGIGLTDAALIFVLTTYGGVTLSAATITALAFRFATTAVEFIYGLLVHISAWQVVRRKYS